MPNLSSTQLNNAEAIANYGLKNGFSEAQIEFAVKVAYIESSLGTMMQSPSTKAAGLFMYMPGTWDQYHAALGDRMSSANQIHAFYDDIARYTARYNDPSINTPIRQAGLTMEQYIYIKHHDGNDYTNFKNAEGLTIYNKSNFHPDITSFSDPESLGAPSGGHAFDFYDPIYAASHAYWFTTSSYTPYGVVTIGDIQLANGQDAD
jgi:hypothetical protein